MSQKKGPEKYRSKKSASKRANAPVSQKRKKYKKRKMNKQEREDNSEWKPYKHKTGRRPNVPIAQLNKILVSPAKQIKILTEHRLNLFGAVPQSLLNEFQLNTPAKGVQTSALVSDADDVTLLRARTIESHVGKISIFLSEDKIMPDAVVDLPPIPSNLDKILESLGLPKGGDASQIDVPISLKTLANINKVKMNRSASRVPSNKKVTNYVSANTLAEALGLEGDHWQWLHLIGHSLWGVDKHDSKQDPAQFFDNLVLGTKHGNAKMNDLAESLVKALLQDKRTPKTLYLSAQADLVPGLEKARVSNKITWTLKDGPGDKYERMVKYEFNPLTIDNLSQSEIETFKDILASLFFEDDHSPIQIISPFKKQNPNPVLLQSPSRKVDFSLDKKKVKPVAFSFDNMVNGPFLTQDEKLNDSPSAQRKLKI